MVAAFAPTTKTVRVEQMKAYIVAGAAAMLLTACGGGSGGDDPLISAPPLLPGASAQDTLDYYNVGFNAANTRLSGRFNTCVDGSCVASASL